jgi:hypothetical protein
VNANDLTQLVDHVAFDYFGELCKEPEEDGRCRMKLLFDEQITTVTKFKTSKP